MPARVVVLGYGSELRRDDAAGRRVAQAVAVLDLPDVEVVVAHQLLPEHAADLAAADAAVFVDASVRDRAVTVRPVAAGALDWRLTHALRPDLLLALADGLGGGPALAHVVSVPVRDLRLGHGLDAATAVDVDTAVARVVALCRDAAEAA